MSNLSLEELTLKTVYKDSSSFIILYMYSHCILNLVLLGLGLLHRALSLEIGSSAALTLDSVSTEEVS